MLRQLLHSDLREVGQLVVASQEHVTTRLDCSREVECVGQPVSARLSGRDGRVSVATADSAGPDVHRGSQAQCPQVGPVEEPEKVRKALRLFRPKKGDETFGARQIADRESMAGL